MNGVPPSRNDDKIKIQKGNDRRVTRIPKASLFFILKISPFRLEKKMQKKIIKNIIIPGMFIVFYLSSSVLT